MRLYDAGGHPVLLLRADAADDHTEKQAGNPLSVFGGLSFGVNVSVFAFFHMAAQMDELIANGISWVATVLFVFFTNRVWVFDAPTRNAKEFLSQLPAPAPFYSWNIYQKRPREKMEAIFCYLGKVFSQKDCYVSNWILGNEVNCPEDWNGAGGMSKEEYFRPTPTHSAPSITASRANTQPPISLSAPTTTGTPHLPEATVQGRR
ncbi:MAG: GtrA family protein [Lachnospiraceae bacterium]|nr:GtrA family protein [Lachnospiraceae bacterium]